MRMVKEHLYVDPGVNDCLEEKEIDIESINNSRGYSHLHPSLESTMKNPLRTQEKVLNEISEDVCVSFDPGRLYTERGMEFIA